MPDNLIYMYGKLSQAVEVLITNRHDVRNRVWVAEKYLCQVQAEGLPESCREDIEWIHQMMNRYPATSVYRSTIEATYHRTRNSTAEKIARRIWKLYHQMQTEISIREEARRDST